MALDTALLDVDGTLIDSSYHAAIAWDRAFASEDLYKPIWQIHRAIGMGGDQIVAYLFDDEVEEKSGKKLRKNWEREYGTLLDDVRAFDGAADFVRSLRTAGLKVALASSSLEKFTDQALKKLGLKDKDFDAVTTSSDAEKSKPEPDIFSVALRKAGGASAFVVGDSTWDILAAQKRGMPTACVRSGGFGEDELRRTGAALVVDSVADLIGRDLSSLG